MNYKISVVYISYRPGGFDLLAHALVHQTYKNYELIVVDDYPGRNLKSWLEIQGIPITYYGPAKEKSIKGTSYNQANVLNTALIRATGELFLICTDYTWIEPNALERWNKFFNDNGLRCVVAGCGKEYEYSGVLHVDDISVFESPFNGNPEKFRFYHDWIPEEFELFYSVIPMDYLLDINGFDEQADYYWLFLYDSVLAQAKLNGMKVMVDRSHFCHMVNHRKWSIGNDAWWHVVRTGVETPPCNVTWAKSSMNVFDIKELRERTLSLFETFKEEDE